MGAAFQIRKGEKEFLGQIGSRLSASRSFIKSIHLYAYPAGGYFSMKKSNPTPEAEKGNRGADMGEKGGKLNKKACCISMLGGRVRLAICPERLYNYNVVICNAHKEAQTRPNKQEGGMEHGTKPQQ